MGEPGPQFALLRHTLSDSTHWDLLLQRGEVLTTWRLLEDPRLLAAAAGGPVRARRIGDHRRAYLDYEGPVSGNRGHVTRLDRGGCEILESQPDRWVVRLSGSLLAGTFQLAGVDPAGQRWEFRRAES